MISTLGYASSTLTSRGRRSRSSAQKAERRLIVSCVCPLVPVFGLLLGVNVIVMAGALAMPFGVVYALLAFAGGRSTVPLACLTLTLNLFGSALYAYALVGYVLIRMVT